MTNRNEKQAAMARSIAQCRAALVREHAGEAEDLLDIAKGFLNETIGILVGLFGKEEAARRMADVVAVLRDEAKQGK